jgi:hypothetical protein
MASDFSVAWQCLWKRKIVFLLRIKLHADRPCRCTVAPRLGVARPPPGPRLEPGARVDPGPRYPDCCGFLDMVVGRS